MKCPRRILFITWDGEAQSYLTSLFLPIFARLRELNVEVHVLQFSFASADTIERTRSVARELGIPYQHRPTPNRFRTPLLPALSVWGAIECLRYTAKHQIDAWMPRSLVPASMVLMARRLKPDVPVIFDADGLMADERLDFAGWSENGLPYRALRRVEASLLEASTETLVRTRQAARILAERVEPRQRERIERTIHVIPNLKNETLFAPATAEENRETRQQLGIADETLMLVSVGSLAAQYFPEQQGRLVKKLLERNIPVHWLVLTGHEDEARRVVEVLELPRNSVTIRRVPATDIPQYVSAADVGLALREAAFSQLAVCPIKIGEYLLCGTPVLATRGVGDVDEYINPDCGMLLDGVGDSELNRAADWVAESARSRREEYRKAARLQGERIFALSRVGELYGPLFRSL